VELTKQFYTDLRKYVQDKLEVVVDECEKHNVPNMQPLKVSLINVSIFCSNKIIEIEKEDSK